MAEDPKNSTFEGTMVDLGEDLLESTRTSASPGATPQIRPANAVASVSAEVQADEDEFQKAEIFFNEKLFDDAKKIFRKIVRKDPANAKAKQFLDEIQKLEIQDLLGGEAPRKRLGGDEAAEADNPTTVLDRLEKELRISIEKSELKPVPDLFRDEAAFAQYREYVTQEVAGSPPRERIDMGIAYLEMGLPEIAQSIFESVVRYDDFKLEGMYLLGVALILGGKAIEATIRLEPLARDLTLGESHKTDFLYLMGLAFERLNDNRKAREFYRRVYMLNPKYRDVLDKLK